MPGSAHEFREKCRLITGGALWAHYRALLLPRAVPGTQTRARLVKMCAAPSDGQSRPLAARAGGGGSISDTACGERQHLALCGGRSHPALARRTKHTSRRNGRVRKTARTKDNRKAGLLPPMTPPLTTLWHTDRGGCLSRADEHRTGTKAHLARASRASEQSGPLVSGVFST